MPLDSDEEEISDEEIVPAVLSSNSDQQQNDEVVAEPAALGQPHSRNSAEAVAIAASDEDSDEAAYSDD